MSPPFFQDAQYLQLVDEAFREAKEIAFSTEGWTVEKSNKETVCWDFSYFVVSIIYFLPGFHNRREIIADFFGFRLVTIFLDLHSFL